MSNGQSSASAEEVYIGEHEYDQLLQEMWCRPCGLFVRLLHGERNAVGIPVSDVVANQLVRCVCGVEYHLYHSISHVQHTHALFLSWQPHVDVKLRPGFIGRLALVVGTRLVLLAFGTQRDGDAPTAPWGLCFNAWLVDGSEGENNDYVVIVSYSGAAGAERCVSTARLAARYGHVQRMRLPRVPQRVHISVCCESKDEDLQQHLDYARNPANHVEAEDN